MPLPVDHLVLVQGPEPGLPEVDPRELFLLPVLPYPLQVLIKALVLFRQQLPVLLYPVQQLPPDRKVPALPNNRSRYKYVIHQNLNLPDQHLTHIKERYRY